MATKNEIELYLNTDLGNDHLCCGKYRANKNKYYYRSGMYYIVHLNNDKYMICSDDNKTRELLNNNIFTISNQYTLTRRNNSCMSFHRMYLEPNSNEICDHINRVRFDNRSENLRRASYLENNRNRSISIKNRSGKQGVSKCKMNGQMYWRASITNNERKLKFASFNIDKLGDDIAFQMACNKRRQWERENGYKGD
jgi:hypothetical protein